MSRNIYSSDLKKLINNAYAMGIGINQLSKITKIPRSTINGWINSICDGVENNVK